MKIISPTIAPLYLHLPLYPLSLLSLPLFLWLCSPSIAGYAAASSDSVAHIHDAFLPIPIFCVWLAIQHPTLCSFCSSAKRLLPVQLEITTTVRWNKNG